MDGKAYMPSDEWDKFLTSRVLEAAEIREGRYNAVFHLVTAAEGAEPFYTLENNEARTETPEQAREQVSIFVFTYTHDMYPCNQLCIPTDNHNLGRMKKREKHGLDILSKSL